MTKEQMLKDMLYARRAAQANNWERALQLLGPVTEELRERSKKTKAERNAKSVRIKFDGKDYRVYKAGAPIMVTTSWEKAITTARSLEKVGYTITETPEEVRL
jgi:putative sterol carrier protein